MGRDREIGLRAGPIQVGSGQSPRSMGKEKELETLKTHAESLNEEINQIMGRLKKLERKQKEMSGMDKGSEAGHARAPNRQRGRGANIYVERRPIKAVPIKNIRPAGEPGYESTSRIRPVRKAVVDMEKCIGCGICENYCLYGAIKIRDGVAKISEVVCTGCGNCVDVCPEQAIRILKKYG